jgi:uncharacterized protein (TIGR02452 family)
VSARLTAVASSTVEILDRGGYTSPAGSWVDLGPDVIAAVAGTRLHLPTDPLPSPGPAAAPTVEVTLESTLEAGQRLGPGTAALVFASARNPGGGFLRGAKAQEEDIARASALYPCLRSVPEFYAFHRSHDDLRYSDRVIYSPDVPVFRDDAHALLDLPYRLSFLTAAAPNRGAIVANQPHLVDSVAAAVQVRAERVLRVAAAHGHRALVLGAWGCGVFANSPGVVAAAFRSALAQVPAFDRVVFAVLDRTGSGPTYRAFVDAFAAA